MALINCIECGKQISDKASICPNCGCPVEIMIEPSTICVINGNPINLEWILSPDINENQKISKLRNDYGLDQFESIWLYGLINNTKKIPSEFNSNERDKNRQLYLQSQPNSQVTHIDNRPKCPFCNSTNIQKISGLSKAGNVALFGVFAMGKVSKQWKCNNCKSEF